MKAFRTVIFGKKYEINIKDENLIIYAVIAEQLSYYQTYPIKDEADIIINICQDLSHLKILKKNPAVHYEIENGFIAVFPTYKVGFYFNNNKLNIDLNIKESGNFLFSYLRKFYNIEYATREERAAQTLFEGALVPSTFFNEELILVHCSGFAKNNRAIIIGGTGGSGKTSLEIELCFNQDFTFINDDMGVIDSSGKILPNLGHPKIYGYNIIGNKLLKEKLFADRKVMDKFHWWFHKRIFGPSKVRRKFFIQNNLKYTSNAINVDKFFILSKESIKEILVEEISGQKAAELNLTVILTEYSSFLNHFYWHEFNSLLDNKKPIINYLSAKKQLLEKSAEVFNKTDNYIIRVPLNIVHSEFIKSTVELIQKTL